MGANATVQENHVMVDEEDFKAMLPRRSSVAWTNFYLVGSQWVCRAQPRPLVALQIAPSQLVSLGESRNVESVVQAQVGCVYSFA